jgi:quinol monooxygenase YgiN
MHNKLDKPRRQLLRWLAASSVIVVLPKAGRASPLQDIIQIQEKSSMYGLIGKILCLDGKREELAQILLKGISAMPGCLSYIVANDPLDANALWITEVWQNQSMHQASLALPSVQDAIKQGRPMITGFGERFETQPLGGTGL